MSEEKKEKKEVACTRYDVTIPYLDRDGEPKYKDWEAVDMLV